MASRGEILLKLKNVDVSQFTFTDLKKTTNPKGTDNSFIGYGPQKAWIRIQFPRLRHPFEPSDPNDDNSRSITLSLDKDADADTIAKLREFDDLIKAKLAENCKQWFKKNALDDSWFKDKYTPFLKIKTDTDEDGNEYEKYYNIKLKMPAKDGVLTTEVVDADTKTAVDPLEALQPRTEVQAIARPSRIWVQKTGKAGVTWELRLCRVFGNKAGNEEAFLADSDDEAAPVAKVERQLAGVSLDEEPVADDAGDEEAADDGAAEGEAEEAAGEAVEEPEAEAAPAAAAPKKGRKLTPRKA